MLKRIILNLPTSTAKAKDSFIDLQKILEQLPNSTTKEKLTILKPTNPQSAYPQIVFKKSQSNSITITFVFSTQNEQDKNLPLQSLLTASQVATNHDNFISLSQLLQKINGHLIRVDHIGVNIPSVRTTKHNWEKMVRSLANSTAIYHYPQEDAWTFIIPSTQEELKNDIRDFCLGREPKFELVYEEYSESPILQFDLETDLKRHKVEELFPAPIGESFKGLENFFRAVRVKSPWKGIGIRFDIRFLDESSHSDWNTGKWLVEKGGRIY